VKHFQKHLLFFVVSCFLSLPSSLQAGIQKSTIAMCAKTGKIFSARNADAITHPASLTKMMTLYLAFKAVDAGHLHMDQKLPVSKYAASRAPCKLGLRAGHFISLRHAILGSVTKSANDASSVIGETLGCGSVTKFAKIMTEQARQLGMTKTVFKNADGLPDPQQITTARDMALLAQALYRDYPHHFHVFKEKSFSYKGVVHGNHNTLLGRLKGMDGIKTGFVNASGSNLAASVVRDNQRIIAVVMGQPGRQARNSQMVKLVEATYANLKRNPTQSEEVYASINDILAQQPSLKQAVYVPSKKSFKAETLDDLFATMVDKNPVKKASVTTKKHSKKFSKSSKKFSKIASKKKSKKHKRKISA